MLYRFPPTPAEATDSSFLGTSSEIFAKLKIESKPGKRTVLATEHMLIMVIKGVKLLHFANETVRLSPGEVVLLRKGIYVMAEYIADGLDFESMMLLLPVKLLRTLALSSDQPPSGSKTRSDEDFQKFQATALIQSFREGLRKYFDHRPSNLGALLPLKQQEILHLLLAGSPGPAVKTFIRNAISDAPCDIDFLVRKYLLQPLSVAELANLANCSLAKFKRDFNRLYNTSPRTWINGKRLEHAYMLLEHSGKSVTEIGQACGFESTSYFIRLFRGQYGCTPTEIRAKIAII